MDIDTTAIKQHHQDWLEDQAQIRAIDCKTIDDVIKVCGRWLHLETGDEEFITVAVAGLLDREIPGDPVWLYIIAPPGGFKTELLRALTVYPGAYSLDVLTPSTLISGMSEKNKETGEYEPIAGILQDLDGKTLVVKDFTTILNSSEDCRTEIYGQLRSAYDGYFEKAFGTMRHPIRVKARFGLLVGVTPVIDKYTKMQSALGERFLKIRNDPDRLQATVKAAGNEGREAQMREELAAAFKSFLVRLSFAAVPRLTEEQESHVISLGVFVASMRANVWASYDDSGRVVDAEVLSAEVPTRVTKQLKHLVKLIAIVRGRGVVLDEDLVTLARVARDTADQKRLAIINFLRGYPGSAHDVVSLSSLPGLYRSSVRNHLEIMRALDILEVVQAGSVERYRIARDFQPYLDAAYYTPPGASLQKRLDLGFVCKGTPGRVPAPDARSPPESANLAKSSDEVSPTLRQHLDKVAEVLRAAGPLGVVDEELARGVGLSLEEARRLLGVLGRDRRAFVVPGGRWRWVA